MTLAKWHIDPGDLAVCWSIDPGDSQEIARDLARGFIETCGASFEQVAALSGYQPDPPT